MTNLIQFMRKNPAFSPAPMPVLMWYHLSDNSWESLKIHRRTHLLLRTEHDSCRIADKRTLGDSWSSIPNVANAFAATLLEAQKCFSMLQYQGAQNVPLLRLEMQRHPKFAKQIPGHQAPPWWALGSALLVAFMFYPPTPRLFRGGGEKNGVGDT